ncbi:hypothetical protein, partial [Pseudomonas lundensis]|uniref:hypothetical protein n=1 Tax=Pseudomonas lundensis TaxID=86185 RepID=UPI001BAF773D
STSCHGSPRCSLSLNGVSTRAGQDQNARMKTGHWFHRVIDMKRDLENLGVMKQRNETRIKLLTEENNRLRALKVVN